MRRGHRALADLHTGTKPMPVDSVASRHPENAVGLTAGVEAHDRQAADDGAAGHPPQGEPVHVVPEGQADTVDWTHTHSPFGHPWAW